MGTIVQGSWPSKTCCHVAPSRTSDRNQSADTFRHLLPCCAPLEQSHAQYHMLLPRHGESECRDAVRSQGFACAARCRRRATSAPCGWPALGTTPGATWRSRCCPRRGTARARGRTARAGRRPPTPTRAAARARAEGRAARARRWPPYAGRCAGMGGGGRGAGGGGLVAQCGVLQRGGQCRHARQSMQQAGGGEV